MFFARCFCHFPSVFFSRHLPREMMGSKHTQPLKINSSRPLKLLAPLHVFPWLFTHAQSFPLLSWVLHSLLIQISCITHASIIHSWFSDHLYQCDAHGLFQIYNYIRFLLIYNLQIFTWLANLKSILASVASNDLIDLCAARVALKRKCKGLSCWWMWFEVAISWRHQAKNSVPVYIHRMRSYLPKRNPLPSLLSRMSRGRANEDNFIWNFEWGTFSFLHARLNFPRCHFRRSSFCRWISFCFFGRSIFQLLFQQGSWKDAWSRVCGPPSATYHIHMVAKLRSTLAANIISFASKRLLYRITLHL